MAGRSRIKRRNLCDGGWEILLDHPQKQELSSRTTTGDISFSVCKGTVEVRTFDIAPLRESLSQKRSWDRYRHVFSGDLAVLPAHPRVQSATMLVFFYLHTRMNEVSKSRQWYSNDVISTQYLDAMLVEVGRSSVSSSNYGRRIACSKHRYLQLRPVTVAGSLADNNTDYHSVAGLRFSDGPNRERDWAVKFKGLKFHVQKFDSGDVKILKEVNSHWKETLLFFQSLDAVWCIDWEFRLSCFKFVKKFANFTKFLKFINIRKHSFYRVNINCKVFEFAQH